MSRREIISEIITALFFSVAALAGCFLILGWPTK